MPLDQYRQPDRPLDLPDVGLPRLVIIGGGFAGIELVKQLQTRHYQVVMLDRHNYHTFQPLLYQVATAGLEPDSIAQPLRKVHAGTANYFFRVARVDRVDTNAKIVHTDIGQVGYDVLVIATGTKTNYFGQDHLRERSFPMKQVPHALDMRSHFLQSFEAALLETDPDRQRALLTFVIVGGGPTGVELGGALSELRGKVLPHDYPELDLGRMDIYLIEGLGRVLNGMSDFAGRRGLKYLNDFGVHVRLNTLVKEIDGDRVKLSDGTEIRAENVIWAAGVTGNLPEGFADTHKAPGNRLRVDEYLRVVGLENVYALGDIAALVTEETPRGHPQLAPVAIQMGQHLGRNLNRALRGRELKPFNYFNKGVMATIGRNRAVVDLPFWGISYGGWFAWVTWMFVHLLYLVGFRNKVVTFLNWTYNYFTYDRGTRLILRPYVKGGQDKPEADEGMTIRRHQETPGQAGGDTDRAHTPAPQEQLQE